MVHGSWGGWVGGGAAMSHEPVTIKNRLIHELRIRLYIIGVRYEVLSKNSIKSFKFSRFQDSMVKPHFVVCPKMKFQS